MAEELDLSGVPVDLDDGVDQTEVTSASGSAVPGQPQTPVNTDPTASQVAPTQAP